MRGMAKKGTFESKSGSRERGAIWQKNKSEEFAVTAWSLTDHFTAFMKKRYKSKTRRDVKGSDLRGEELSATSWRPYREIWRKWTQNRSRCSKKTVLYKERKKESSTNEKKRKRKIWRETKTCKEQDESGTRDKNKVEGVAHKWLVFFEKNLNKIANLDQKTCKKKTMKGKLEKDSIPNQLIIQNQKMQAQQSQAIQAL